MTRSESETKINGFIKTPVAIDSLHYQRVRVVCHSYRDAIIVVAQNALKSRTGFDRTRFSTLYFFYVW